MRLCLLLGSLSLILQQIEAQRSWWNRGYHGHRSRRRDRPRRYRHSDQSGGHRHTGHHDEAGVSSRQLSRRVSPRDEARDYYPDTRANTSEVLEDTPEYRIQTRGGDTIIEFARSGETQGRSMSLKRQRIRRTKNIIPSVKNSSDTCFVTPSVNL